MMLIKTESSVSMFSFHPLLAYFSQLPVINLIYFDYPIYYIFLKFFILPYNLISLLTGVSLHRKAMMMKGTKGLKSNMNLGAAATFTEWLYG